MFFHRLIWGTLTSMLLIKLALASQPYEDDLENYPKEVKVVYGKPRKEGTLNLQAAIEIESMPVKYFPERPSDKIVLDLGSEGPAKSYSPIETSYRYHKESQYLPYGSHEKKQYVSSPSYRIPKKKPYGPVGPYKSEEENYFMPSPLYKMNKMKRPSPQSHQYRNPHQQQKKRPQHYNPGYPGKKSKVHIVPSSNEMRKELSYMSQTNYHRKPYHHQKPYLPPLPPPPPSYELDKDNIYIAPPSFEMKKEKVFVVPSQYEENDKEKGYGTSYEMNSEKEKGYTGPSSYEMNSEKEKVYLPSTAFQKEGQTPVMSAEYSKPKVDEYVVIQKQTYKPFVPKDASYEKSFPIEKFYENLTFDKKHVPVESMEYSKKPEPETIFIEKDISSENDKPYSMPYIERNSYQPQPPMHSLESYDGEETGQSYKSQNAPIDIIEELYFNNKAPKSNDGQSLRAPYGYELISYPFSKQKNPSSSNSRAPAPVVPEIAAAVKPKPSEYDLNISMKNMRLSSQYIPTLKEYQKIKQDERELSYLEPAKFFMESSENLETFKKDDNEVTDNLYNHDCLKHRLTNENISLLDDIATKKEIESSSKVIPTKIKDESQKSRYDYLPLVQKQGTYYLTLPAEKK